MPYIIDGHNLIPRIIGLNLDDLDDELALIDLLEGHFRRIRKKAVVFFDRGQPGESAELHRGFVQVRFVHPPMIADRAITDYLKSKRGAAKNYMVVSSDREVMEAAENLGARVLTSEKFAQVIYSRITDPISEKRKQSDDLDFWLEVFNQEN